MARGVRRAGVLKLSKRQLEQATFLSLWPAADLQVQDGDLVSTPDRSKLSRLLRRQLAVGAAFKIEELRKGVARTHACAVPSLDALLAWCMAQPDVELRLKPASAQLTSPSSWQTREDKLVLSLFGEARQLHRQELTAGGVAAGRSAKAIGQVITRSPILRSTGTRGYCKLLGHESEKLYF